MLVPQLARGGRRIVVVSVLIWTVSADAQPASKTDAADFGQLAEILAPPGTPSIKEKRWVTIATGPLNWPTELRGWLIEDGAQEVLLLDWEGEAHKLRKPAPDEKRPKVKEDKEGRLTLDRESDGSVAWKVNSAITPRAARSSSKAAYPKRAATRTSMPQ
jgi:hypothetical protein